MKKVIIESPFSGDIPANVAYAKRAIMDCLSRNEAPIASHLLFTQEGILDDSDTAQRSLGIEAGHAWHCVADAVVVYADRGISEGMMLGIKRATANNTPVFIRMIGA